MHHTEKNKTTLFRIGLNAQFCKNVLDLPNSYPTKYSQFPSLQFRFEVLTLWIS